MDISRASACTYALNKKSAEYALHVIAGAGFKKVDLWGGMPHFSIDESEYDVDKLIEDVSTYGLQIANIGTYCGGKFSSDSKEEVQQELRDTKKTIDIAQSLGAKKKGQFLVGFALETENELKNAEAKLQKKNLDFIVLNSLSEKGAGFKYDTNIPNTSTTPITINNTNNTNNTITNTF